MCPRPDSTPDAKSTQPLCWLTCACRSQMAAGAHCTWCVKRAACILSVAKGVNGETYRVSSSRSGCSTYWEGGQASRRWVYGCMASSSAAAAWAAAGAALSASCQAAQVPSLAAQPGVMLVTLQGRHEKAASLDSGCCLAGCDADTAGADDEGLSSPAWSASCPVSGSSAGCCSDAGPAARACPPARSLDCCLASDAAAVGTDSDFTSGSAMGSPGALLLCVGSEGAFSPGRPSSPVGCSSVTEGCSVLSPSRAMACGSGKVRAGWVLTSSWSGKLSGHFATACAEPCWLSAAAGLSEVTPASNSSALCSAS